jgi:hypothetical protein
MKLPRISPRNLPLVIDAIAHFPDDPRSGLQTILETESATAGRHFEAAEMLGLIDSSGTPAELASLMRDASVVERREILRHYVEAFPAYAAWKRRVGQGFDPLEAARMVKAVYSIEDTPADTRDWLLSLGAYCGSIRDDGLTISPVQSTGPELGSLISNVLNRREGVVEVLSGYIGEAAWDKLPESVKEHLRVALDKLAEGAPPDEAVRESGLAMDKFMSDLGESLKGGYTGKTMGQVADQLQADSFLVKKQKGYTAYGVNIRNAAEHPDTDADLGGDRWTITGPSALTYLRVVLDFIRSATAKQEGRYEL